MSGSRLLSGAMYPCGARAQLRFMRGLNQRAQGHQHLTGCGDRAAHPAVEQDRALAVHGQANILDHLPGGQLHGEDPLQVIGAPEERVLRERPERDGPEEADADALGSRQRDHAAQTRALVP